jgi:hypothetical protein
VNPSRPTGPTDNADDVVDNNDDEDGISWKAWTDDDATTRFPTKRQHSGLLLRLRMVAVIAAAWRDRPSPAPPLPISLILDPTSTVNCQILDPTYHHNNQP